jgi:hypothetical protein
MKSSSRSCAETASAISRRQCPALTQNSPDEASISRSPRSFQRYAVRSRDYLRIELELAVGREGIQYSSIEMVFVASLSVSLSSA